ncbi:hypothetical protein OUHCRE11_47260 [Enterobacter asburiae]
MGQRLEVLRNKNNNDNKSDIVIYYSYFFTHLKYKIGGFNYVK